MSTGIPSWARVWLVTGIAAVALGAGTGCNQSAGAAPPSSQPGTSQPTTGAATMKLSVRSPAFKAGEPIPKTHTGEAEDLSPALSWADVPSGAEELALIVDDPDAPGGDWVHWVLYKLPVTAKSLKAGLPREARLNEPIGALQGKNSWGTTGYRGPMPPPGHGTHHYRFKLYALNASLTLSAGATKAQLLSAMRGHILADGELVGTYAR
jgi:Raf kinase inhibitor-like YbhB/YbcL family protein